MDGGTAIGTAETDLARGGSAVAARVVLPSVAAQRDQLFYIGMAVAGLATIALGFAKTYFLRSYFHPTPLAPVIKAHGAVFTTWMLLYATQTALVVGQRRDVHRRLGLVGVPLSVALFFLGLMAATVQARRNWAGGNKTSLTFMAVLYGDMIVFGALAVAGFLFRRRREVHKRLMLLTMISILDAAIARWPFAFLGAGPIAFFAVTDVFLLACIAYELIYHRVVHPAFLWGSLFLMISQPLRVALGSTGVWLAWAREIVK
jgi:hypothetical protein